MKAGDSKTEFYSPWKILEIHGNGWHQKIILPKKMTFILKKIQSCSTTAINRLIYLMQRLRNKVWMS